MSTCGSCGREAPDDFAFCPACGAALSVETAAGARRVVTILFADIVGSTELGERLDPERLQIVLTRYFDTMRAVIERHGGTVEKFIGDAVMAVFGIPRIREDDALRAVRAAAEMGDALDELNGDLAVSHDVRIRMRIGINTGEVMVADVATGTIASGDAVNVAARLEQAAQAGEILIGARTHQLVRDAILAEPRDPLSVKGKREPLLTYRVVKVDPEAAGFTRRLDAPMVGRARELSLLYGAFERTVSDHACQLFTVLGVGGVGKSRLLEAFVAALGERAVVLRGRCLPYGDGITFLPVAEAIRQATGLTGLEGPEDAHERLAALIPGDQHADRIARQVGQVIGVRGEVNPEETLWSVRRFLEGIASERPVVFLIDDVQWAEPMMLDLVEHIADWSVDAPILLACMARPELLEVRPDWGGGKLNATAISLEALTGSECATLVANLLATDDVSPNVRERVAEAAEGHPLFAEELLAMLVEEGRIQHVEGAWVASGDLSEIALPPTASALIAARIDRLGPRDRSVLERASVIGQVFYRDALGSDEDLGERLASLLRRQFIRPERSDMPGMEALAFRHLLIRDAAYDGLAKAARASEHERFAIWLESHAIEQDELAGYHFEQAHRFHAELGDTYARAGELAARAAAHLRDAGRASLDRGDIPATVNLLTRAVSLMPPDDIALVPVLLDLSVALTESGAFDETRTMIDRAVGVAEDHGDEVLTARARVFGYWSGFWGHLSEEEFSASEAFVRASIPLFERSGDTLGVALGWCILGSYAWSHCRSAEAETLWRRALVHFEAAGSGRMVAEYRSWLGSTQVWGPTPCVEALRNLEELARVSEGMPAAELALTGSTGMVLVMQGELDEARRLFEAIDRDLRERGRSVAQAHNTQELGLLELLSGDAEASARILGEGAQALADIGSDAGHIISAMLGQALYACGRYEEADEAAIRALKDVHGVSERVLGLGIRGMVAARRGAFEEGERMAREGVVIIDESDFPCDRADARMALAEVLQVSGRMHEAADAMREAIALFDAKGNILQGDLARTRLAALNA